MKKKTKSALGGGNRRSNILIMLLLAALIVTTLPLTSPVTMTAQAISDCGNHSWGAWEVTIEPTCIAWGNRVRRCKNCITEEIEDLRPTGKHRFEVTPLTQETPATCTQAGSRTLYCGVCGESKEEKIPALDHAWDGGTVTKEAGCTEAGVKTFNCTRCGHTETEQIAALGHNHQTITTKEAACTAEGEKETKCLRCGESTKEKIPALGHNHQETVTKQPTCTEAGEKETKCTRCGESTKEKIPALGHNHQETVTKQATCTEAGEKEAKCTRCGDSKKTEIPALGHDWDRSETKEPEGFTDGEAVAKCRRCGETEKQVISAAAAVLNKLRNGGKATTRDNTEKYDPLKIVEQSTGDFFVNIGTDESVTLSVKAEGGVEPYTYTWHEVPIPGFHYGGGNTLNGNVSANVSKQVNKTALAYTGRVSKAAGNYRAKKPGESLVAQRQRLSATERLAARMTGRTVVWRDASAQQKASTGGYYWYCVVEDAAGNQAMSENVWVFYYPYLIRQPENVNVHNGPATTAFVASGGSQEFYYEWYDAKDGTRISEAQTDGSITLDKPGEYYCEAINIDLNEPWRSDTIRAYNAQPLWVRANQAEYEFDPAKDKEITIQFSFRGGMPGNYMIRYSVNGTVKEEYTVKLSRMGGNGRRVESFTVSERESNADEHMITVTDEAGETSSAVCTVIAPKLKIKKQPVGGYLDDSNYTLSIEMEKDVESRDLEYRLYNKNSGEVQELKKPNSHSCSFQVFRSGVYYIRVDDSASRRWAVSDTIYVENDVVRITSKNSDRVIQKSGQETLLFVDVEGGKKPYFYRWELISASGASVVPESLVQTLTDSKSRYETNVCTVNAPGIYRCTVADSNGETAFTDTKVESLGKEPRIVCQPEERIALRDMNGNDHAQLVCIAKSVTGDDSGLSYSWQKEGLHHGGFMTFFGGYGTGPVLDLSGKDIAGVYRCWVYDQKTYEGVYSFKVRVFTELQCEITDMEHKGVYASIHYEIQGGAAPYEVELHVRRRTVNDSYMTARLRVDKKNAEGKYKFGNELSYYYYYITDGGEYISQGAQTEYYIKVTDANGQITYSNTSK